MRAMVLKEIGKPLQLEEVPYPSIVPHEILLKVHTCGVCRTDLHIFEGELKNPKLPLILGHQIVGVVTEVGEKVKDVKVGMRMGVPWMASVCGRCDYCKEGKENLCDSALFTGYQRDGGFAEYCVANPHFACPLPSNYDDLHAAPLLCAGFIGYRAYKVLSKEKKIGFYGFGSSAHILTQIAVKQGKEIYAFSRKEDHEKQAFAKSLGATWVGSIDEPPPVTLDGAIIFAPAGEVMIEALKYVKKGGIVVSSGIYMSDIPTFPYSLLWNERTLTSVTNLTHEDGQEFMALAAQHTIHTEITSYPLEKANEALQALKEGKLSGSIVLQIV